MFGRVLFVGFELTVLHGFHCSIIGTHLNDVTYPNTLYRMAHTVSYIGLHAYASPKSEVLSEIWSTLVDCQSQATAAIDHPEGHGGPSAPCPSQQPASVPAARASGPHEWTTARCSGCNRGFWFGLPERLPTCKLGALLRSSLVLNGGTWNP